MTEFNRGDFFLLHASETVSRDKRHGWTVVTNSNGRVQSPSFLPRKRQIRLFQHAAAGLI